MRTVLVIEDNPTMLRGLQDNFELKGYRVKTALDGEQGLNTAFSEKPDLIILDIVLPKINGYEICRLIRKKDLDMPIIMVTGKTNESDIILGLNLGADDYMTKPFSIRELLARAEVLLRRKGQGEPATYKFGSCRLDVKEGTLTRSGKEVTLSPKEFEMLHLFLRRAGYALTPDEILNTVWGYSHFISLRDVERSVTTLRNKIEPDPNNPRFIHTIKDIGYKFELPELNGNSFNN